MNRNAQTYWLHFARRHPRFSTDDLNLAKKIKRLMTQHTRLAEYDCNGEGWVRGKKYRTDSENAYVNANITIFYAEMKKIEQKIRSMLKGKRSFSVEFQGDPRGWTVKLFYGKDMIDWNYV